MDLKKTAAGRARRGAAVGAMALLAAMAIRPGPAHARIGLETQCFTTDAGGGSPVAQGFSQLFGFDACNAVVLAGTQTGIQIQLYNNELGAVFDADFLNVSGGAFVGADSFGNASGFANPPYNFSMASVVSPTYTLPVSASAGPTGISAPVTGAVDMFQFSSIGGEFDPEFGHIDLSATVVAPINSVTAIDARARVNTYGFGGNNVTTIAGAVVRVANTGHGNQALPQGVFPGPQDVTNLNGSVVGPVSGDFAATFDQTTLSLQDGGQANVSYPFAPTARGLQVLNLTAAFDNGDSSGSNAAQSVPVALSGIGVGAEYNSSLGTSSAAAHSAMDLGSYNTPTANSGTGTIDFAQVIGVNPVTLWLSIANTSMDDNGGNSLLTDLSLHSLSLSGTNASSFSIGVPITVLGQYTGANDYLVPITFAPSAVGDYTAQFRVSTDQNTGFSLQGDSFTYNLMATVQAQVVPEQSVPEPASMALLGMGLAGLLVTRRRR